jgi:hypothetical protein
VVSGESMTNEPTDASENVTNERTGELVSGPSSVVSGENATNEPTDSSENATSVPTGAWENVTNEPTESEAGDGRPPSSGPPGHLLPRGEGNLTNEPTDAAEIVTNEPTDGSENVTNEPTDGSENVTNEPTGAWENVTNAPTDAWENVTNEPTDPQATGGHAPSSGPASHVLPARGQRSADELGLGAEGDDSEDGSAVRRGWDDPALAADVDWDQTDEWVRQGKEKVRRERAEQLRELNERARREMEANRALHRARRAERKSRKPAVSTRQRTGTPAESEQKQLKRLTAELARLTKPLPQGLGRAAAPAKGPAP